MISASRSYPYNIDSAFAIANVTFPLFSFGITSTDFLINLSEAKIAAGSATATAPVAALTVSDSVIL
jgi:hypothetical protein